MGEICRAVKRGGMNDREIINKCQMDTDECLLKVGNLEVLLKRLQETGGYDSITLLEAISKVSEQRQQLNVIQSRLLELSNSCKTK
jgi:hypothetical protein